MAETRKYNAYMFKRPEAKMKGRARFVPRSIQDELGTVEREIFVRRGRDGDDPLPRFYRFEKTAEPFDEMTSKLDVILDAVRANNVQGASELIEDLQQTQYEDVKKLEDFPEATKQVPSDDEKKDDATAEDRKRRMDQAKLELLRQLVSYMREIEARGDQYKSLVTNLAEGKVSAKIADYGSLKGKRYISTLDDFIMNSSSILQVMYAKAYRHGRDLITPLKLSTPGRVALIPFSEVALLLRLGTYTLDLLTGSVTLSSEPPPPLGSSSSSSAGKRSRVKKSLPTPI